MSTFYAHPSNTTFDKFLSISPYSLWSDPLRFHSVYYSRYFYFPFPILFSPRSLSHVVALSTFLFPYSTTLFAKVTNAQLAQQPFSCNCQHEHELIIRFPGSVSPLLTLRGKWHRLVQPAKYFRNANLNHNRNLGIHASVSTIYHDFNQINL